jgi:sulfur relay (sulfurtransferase) DsrC/TusE family protein
VWTPDQAEALARDAGIPRLTGRHWKIITLCREEAARRGDGPGIDRICALSGFNRDELLRLFPGKPERVVALIAGLSGTGPEAPAGAPQEKNT